MVPQLRPSRFRLGPYTGAAGVLVALAIAQTAWAHDVTPPKPLEQPAPVWPEGKPESHDVVVPVVLMVAPDGTVTDAQVEASLGAAFDGSALAAARRWRFEPAIGPGKRAVAAKVRAMVRFVASPMQRSAASTMAVPAAETGEQAAAGTERPAANPDQAAAGTERPAANPDQAAAGTERPAANPDQAAAGIERPAVAAESDEGLPSASEAQVVGKRVTPPRSASETTLQRDVIQAAPHRTGGDLLQIVPGVFITQHSGQGKAYQVFYRGFDAIHGQDLEFWVGGAPVNEVSNVHGQGYADLHFVMPEVVSEILVRPGNYAPDQGDFAIAGSVRYDLGYGEPGLTAKGTLGSHGERRVFLGYHPSGDTPASFAAFEAQSTDGFGPSRAASRTSAVAQHVLKLGTDRLRILATAYAGRFDSPGVVRLRDIEARQMDRFGSYGLDQGGFSARYQLVMEYAGGRGRSEWSVTPYVVARALRLTQNYTGYLVYPTDGDTTQQINESTTLGLTACYRQRMPVFSSTDAVEAGVSFRNDGIQQSQLHLGGVDGRVLSTVVDAQIRATNAAGWASWSVRPIPRIAVRGGVRVDGLAFGIQDRTSGTDTRTGTDAAANLIRPPAQGGQARAATGIHVGPRVTVDGTILDGVHALASYGEGFRSPQARSLNDGEKAPFTTVQSFEVGVRISTDVLVGSLSGFRTALSNDLVFDPVTARNEAVPRSARVGGALDLVVKPRSWLVWSGSATWTRATFSESDGTYGVGDKLPYVPEVIVRNDVAFTPVLGEALSRPLTGRFGLALTGMLERPQPYGRFGHDVFLVDAVAELRLKELALGLDVYNLFDARWYDSEFTFSANWARGATPSLVPERYVTAGAPRTFLATVSLFVP